MKHNQGTFKVLIFLVAISCLINGLLAGENTFRYIIEVPAWQHLDLITWAEYSRHADLGNGIFLFSIEAIAGTLLSCIAAVIVMKNDCFSTTAAAVYLTALFALAGIGLTFFAAPQMLQLRGDNIDLQQVRSIFEKFHYWGKWRALAQILAFFTNLIALAGVYSCTKREYPH